MAMSPMPVYRDPGPRTGHNMAAECITMEGGGQMHENVPPYLSINYIIALEGVYPSRN
jgi:microcystin-dependent protein